MTETPPEALAAFLTSAEYAILQAPQDGDEDASEALITAGCWYAPRLLAAVEAVRALADEWDIAAIRLADEVERVSPRNQGRRVLLEVRSELRLIQARAVRDAIRSALLGEGG